MANHDGIEVARGVAAKSGVTRFIFAIVVVALPLVAILLFRNFVDYPLKTRRRALASQLSAFSERHHECLRSADACDMTSAIREELVHVTSVWRGTSYQGKMSGDQLHIPDDLFALSRRDVLVVASSAGDPNNPDFWVVLPGRVLVLSRPPEH